MDINQAYLKKFNITKKKKDMKELIPLNFDPNVVVHGKVLENI